MCAKTTFARKTPIDLDIERHVREAHMLRSAYVIGMLKAFARSLARFASRAAGDQVMHWRARRGERLEN